MVGPASDADGEAMTQLKVAIVALVGASAGLITLSDGGSAVQVALAVGGGLVVGAALLAYLAHIT
jgi:hypothetical protein